MVYGVFCPMGEVQTFRTTKRDATKAAERLKELSGETFTVRRLDK